MADEASASAAPSCGATTYLGSLHEEPVEFVCKRPEGHRGWHSDKTESDEYRWAATEGQADDD